MSPASVVVMVENPNNFWVVKVDGRNLSSILEKRRAKIQKKFRWLLVLKSSEGCLLPILSFLAVWKLLPQHKSLLSSSRALKSHKGCKYYWYFFISFYIVYVMALLFEIYEVKNELHLIHPPRIWFSMTGVFWSSFQSEQNILLHWSLLSRSSELLFSWIKPWFILYFWCLWIKFKNLWRRSWGNKYSK